MRIRHAIETLVGIAAVVLMGGCASARPQAPMSMQEDAAGLWSSTCAHCHNLRPAPEFSAEQWSIIVQHMRKHGDLTRSQALSVADYLWTIRER